MSGSGSKKGISVNQKTRNCQKSDREADRSASGLAKAQIAKVVAGLLTASARIGSLSRSLNHKGVSGRRWLTTSPISCDSLT